MYVNGDKFEGAFANGVACGLGKFYKANGDIYVGEYANDVKHGFGIYTYINGDIFDGKYDHGRWKFGEFITSSGDRQVIKDGEIISEVHLDVKKGIAITA
jgi:hypothetical protein